jgi:beta propeller repeat protein
MVLILAAPTPLTTGAGLADLPYRLVPGATSSIGLEQSSLRASGSLIVWEDSRNGLPDVYLFDLGDERERRVSKTSAIRRQPSVSRSTIVWVNEDSAHEREIRGVDLAEGIEFSISELGDVAAPAIDRHLVVWQQRVDGVWNIHATDISNKQQVRVTSESTNQAYPQVSGSVIVWQGHDGTSWNVYAHDLRSGDTRQLTDDAADDQYPAISGDFVVFARSTENGGPPEIVLYDLTRDEEHAIVSGHFVMRPAISGPIVVWEDWRSGLPDVYAYDIEHDQMFAVARSQQAASPAVSSDVVAWISGNDPRSQRVQTLLIQQRLPTDPQEPPAVPSPVSLYVQETQQFVSAGFKAYWQKHGGPRLLGYPLTTEFTETDPATGAEIIVQYFERVKMEYHPDAPEEWRVRLARLGVEFRPEREIELVEPFESSANRRYFPQTGHSLSHGFKRFWERYGGLELFGYPITEEMVENGRVVQYFERARFEFNPDADADMQVTLSLLGREALQRKGWLPMPPIDTTQIFE